MPINVKLDVTEAVAGLDDLQKRQIPFALAKTLTGVVKVAQKAVQSGLGSKFKLRNNFTLQGIRIKPASKTGSNGIIAADVHTDTANRATGAPDYLLRQNDGGEKVPINGRHFLAIPTEYLRFMAPGIIPDELRPRNLLGAVNGRYTAIRRGKGQIALRNQRRVRGFVFFIQELKDGHKAIMGRHESGKDILPFYLLIPEANVKPVLEMGETVEIAAKKAFPELWSENWRTIMLRGLKIK
jgi:hypothetical protein